jgi:hypothetical protein
VAGVLDGAQPGGDAGLASGDGLAVALAVGAVRPVGAGPLDLAGVGFPFVGVRGEGEHGDARCGGVQDKGDRASFGVMAGQGCDPGPVSVGPRLLRCTVVVPGAGASEKGVVQRRSGIRCKGLFGGIKDPDVAGAGLLMGECSSAAAPRR